VILLTVELTAVFVTVIGAVSTWVQDESKKPQSPIIRINFFILDYIKFFVCTPLHTEYVKIDY